MKKGRKRRKILHLRGEKVIRTGGHYSILPFEIGPGDGGGSYWTAKLVFW